LKKQERAEKDRGGKPQYGRMALAQGLTGNPAAVERCLWPGYLPGRFVNETLLLHDGLSPPPSR
jgi:hypothetical protein